MLIIILLLILGGLCGFLLRRQEIIIKYVNILTNLVIWLLLLFLGISVGSNEKIIKNIKIIGLNAVIISVGAVIGSVIVSYVVYQLYFSAKSGSRRLSGKKVNEK